MKLPDPRDGEVVNIRKRPTPFSFFPTYQGTKREGLQSTLFATDPWNLIRHNLESIANPAAQHQAQAFWVQARDFFNAAQNSDVNAAKPLLLYYSFLNLAKCFVVRSTGAPLGTVHHGLSEKLPTTAGAIHGNVSIDINKSPATSAFVMFANALGVTLPTVTAPNTHVQMRSQDFLGQILIGHRIYCQAENIIERFVSLDRLDYLQNPATKEVWLRARAYADDFDRLGYNMTSLSKQLKAALTWRNVKCDTRIDSRRIIEAETTTTIQYGDRPSQVIGQLSKSTRSRLWRGVTSYPPYRKYYIYQETSTQMVLDQILTIYLATFYFGSITRYKPEQFDFILKSPVGPFVFEFFSNQPSQFLYLIASEFLQQEVARAAIA